MSSFLLNTIVFVLFFLNLSLAQIITQANSTERVICVFYKNATQQVRANHISRIKRLHKKHARLVKRDDGVVPEGKGKDINIKNFNAYTGEFSPATLNEIINSPSIKYVEVDKEVKLDAVEISGATWGLDRVSHKVASSENDYNYQYDDSAGQNTDIYIIDTGIQTDHPEFKDRVSWGANFADTNNTDGHGHGTHCAGTAAGASVGVAKKANLIAVKVLGTSGSGYNSWVIQGVQWAVQNAVNTGRRGVLSMSLGSKGVSSAVNDAVQNAVAAGLAVAVAAGNSGDDASLYSPASSPNVITVGAIDTDDSMPYWSNSGSALDIFAPGVDIYSSYIGSTYEYMSGTSMATPHVAGLLAYLWGLNPNGNCNDTMSALKSYGIQKSISGARDGSPALIAFNNFGGASNTAPAQDTTSTATSTSTLTTESTIQATTTNMVDASTTIYSTKIITTTSTRTWKKARPTTVTRRYYKMTRGPAKYVTKTTTAVVTTTVLKSRLLQAAGRKNN